MEQSIIEWLQGVFDGIEVPSFDRLYDGDIQLKALNQMEPQIWDSKILDKPTANPSRKFVTSNKTLLSRADKVKFLQYLHQQSEEYFNQRNEPSVIPINFKSTQIDQMIDMHSQRALLATIDLMLIVMLNCE